MALEGSTRDVPLYGMEYMTRPNITYMTVEETRAQVESLRPVLEEIKDVVVEGETNAGLELLVAYHHAGEIIIKNNLGPATVARYIGRSERTVYYMIKLADKFHSVSEIPGPKILSWHQVIKDHLTTPSDPKEHEHIPFSICRICRKAL